MTPESIVGTREKNRGNNKIKKQGAKYRNKRRR
jgi:hypothetical protein